MASAATVFAIPELFELVLLHLSTEDLLFSQRVAKSWQALFQGSLPIQQALFLMPAWPKALLLVHDLRDTHHGTPFSAMSAKNVRIIGEVSTAQAKRLPWSMQSTTCTRARLNHLFQKLTHSEHDPIEVRTFTGDTTVLTKPLRSVSDSGLRMFLTQPPCTTAFITTQHNGPWSPDDMIRNNEGVTLADVARRLASFEALEGPISIKLTDAVCLSEDEEVVMIKMLGNTSTSEMKLK